MRLMLALCLFGCPALAQGDATPPVAEEEVATCPAAPDHAQEQASLLARLKGAPDEMAANVLMDRLWQTWTDAPDSRAQGLLDDGMARRESYDFLGARDIFDELVNYCLDYAEG